MSAGPPRQRCPWRCSRLEALGGGPVLPNLCLSHKRGAKTGRPSPLPNCVAMARDQRALGGWRPRAGQRACGGSGCACWRGSVWGGWRWWRKPVNTGPAEGWGRGFLRDQSLPPSPLWPPCPVSRLPKGLGSRSWRAGRPGPHRIEWIPEGNCGSRVPPAGCVLIQPALHPD